MNEYFIEDARKLDSLFKEAVVDLVITSPPYFNLKDYGSPNQIGFKQNYTDYIGDLKKVFEKCFKVSKDNASLWIVIDNIRKDNNFKLLSFELIKIVGEAGWHLQDIIIWKKDRTIPFAHKGQMRNIFEYVLFFTKSDNYKYYPERITSVQNLKEWWQKYPERYSPKGTLPTNIWDFPIPIQGSWGNNYIRHFCPLPEGLIKRIIHLCSDVNDIVFDPFAGTGSVLSAAYKLKRHYYGCDLNFEYKKQFLDYLKTVKIDTNIDTDTSKTQLKEFGITIEKLRILKFPKVLFNKVNEILINSQKIIYILAIPTPNLDKEEKKGSKLLCKYVFVFTNNSDISNRQELIDSFEKIIKKVPLSKFGINAQIEILTQSEALEYANVENMWCYKNGKTHLPPKHTTSLSSTHDVETIPDIYSTIRIQKEELKW